MKVQPAEMRLLAQYIQTICGIALEDSKAYLVESRLSELAVNSGCRSFTELVQRSRADSTCGIQRKIIDAITIGETSFFRDMAPFELLQHKILPDIIDRRSKSALSSMPVPIRIWSAASSTGQEIYSIAMVIKEMLGDTSRFNIRIMGTDISDQAVSIASKGIYSRAEVDRGLTPNRLDRFFMPFNNAWKVRDELRALVSFRTLNLMEDFSRLGRFDIIFCRNVAIYFAESDRVSLFNRLAQALDTDGHLIIGSTESLTGINTKLEPKRYLRSVFYQIKSGIN
jgi:chemotaxis protein methyltransferase CheR